jgi:hypothetical protein
MVRDVAEFLERWRDAGLAIFQHEPERATQMLTRAEAVAVASEQHADARRALDECTEPPPPDEPVGQIQKPNSPPRPAPPASRETPH